MFLIIMPSFVCFDKFKNFEGSLKVQAKITLLY